MEHNEPNFDSNKMAEKSEKKEDGTNKCENNSADANQMMNSAILVRAEIDDDSQSMTTPGVHDEEETKSVVTTDTNGNDNDELSEMDSQIPPLESYEAFATKDAGLKTVYGQSNGSLPFTEEEEDEIPDLIENFLEEPSSPKALLSPLCDYTVYEQSKSAPQTQSPVKCIYKKDVKPLLLLNGAEVAEAAWWDILVGKGLGKPTTTQNNDR